MIYHIVAAADWASAGEEYLPAAYVRDGFVHCSEARQVEASADRHYASAEPPLVLEIDEARLASPLRREDLLGGGEEFPHIYGAIQRSAVTAALPLLRGADGRFRLPLGSVPGAASASEAALRRATAEDAAILGLFRFAMFKDMHPETDYSGIREALVSGSEEYYRRHADDPACATFVVASDSGPVACATLIVEERPPHAKRLRNLSGYVLSVYVEPEYRGRGFARALMERIREESATRGLRRLALHASTLGAPMYRSLGYLPNPGYLELEL